MKKILTAICLILLCALFIVSCDISSNYEDNNNGYDDNYVSPNHDETEEVPDSTDCLSHNWVSATCTKPETCSTCGLTVGYSLGHDWNDATCTKPKTCSTCGETVGYSLLEHDWNNATCTKPKTCSTCGETDGEPRGHDYRNYGDYKCGCGEVDPKVTEILAKCSLELPNLPQTLNYYGYNGSIYSSVKVTKITYDFKYDGDGKVTLTAKFSGTKTYDSKGTNQSGACHISWKLYDPTGNVFDSDTYYSPAIAVGESFAGNDEERLIRSSKAAAPGKYKLVLTHTN